MAAFSPSPAPRLMGQRRSSPRGTPPTGAIRRPRIGSRTPGPSSRLATPGRHDRQSVDNSVGSGMDVDEAPEVFERGSKTETVFAKSEELQVTFYAHLPAEVKQILHNADFDREPYTGDVDPVTGFALVASANTCFVWKYAQALTGTPTCYIFECPQEIGHLAMATPFHALVPYGPSREPGLILMTSTGHIRFWDGLGMGLAGGKNYSSSSLDLAEDELVTTLTRADSQTYVVSTSAGRLFRLVLTSSGSKYQLVSRVFGRPQFSFSLTNFLPSLWSAETIQPVQGNVDAVALGELSREASRRDLWVLIDFHVQRWGLSIEGWEALESQESILELVLDAVRARFASAARDNIELNLEFVDLKSPGSNRLVLLISFAGQEAEEEMAIDTQPRRIYAIVQLSALTGSFKVDNVKSVPYQSTSSSHAQMHPRLQLILGGKIVGVQFGDTVTICSRDTEYMDRLELKLTSDRTFGLGVVEGESELLVLTAATLMKTTIDEDAVANFDPEYGRANLIKSTMTQAILYGSHVENPLYFSFPPEIDPEALMSGAEQLSQAILESDIQVVRPNHDLQAQMTSRKERLSFLIKFINDNAVISKMSQSSRQRLATDAEKLYAAHQLWLKHNERISAGNGNGSGLLSDAVYTYMRAVGEGHHEDFMRAFFRLKVDDIGSLLPHVMSVLRSSVHDPTRGLLTTVPQANSTVLTILQSAVNYRQYNSGVYGIEGTLIRPWTSLPVVLDIVYDLFGVTTKLVESSNDLQPSRRRTEATGQLPELASVLFLAFQERLQWLGSPMASDDPDAGRDREALDHRFKQLRPEILEILRRNGFSAQAFKLAEDFRDFRSLASLCHKDVIYPPEENPNAERIQSYIERFNEDFTTELYQWYVEHGELRTMFAQEHGDYLDKFFSRRPNPNISWIQDLGKGRFGPASDSLLSEAETASELATKHLMLSIGKLSHLAQLHEGVASPINESVLDAFHDGLDFVSVHETLLEDLKTALASVRARQSLEMQVDTIVQAKASKLDVHKAFQNVFRQFVRRLLQGKALSVEDAADVLSLKDNSDTLDDYVTALHLLSFAKNLPDSRRLSAFRSVWRRIYIHDDWDSIRKTSGVTDEELNERFKNTALHTVLQATMDKRHQPKGYLLLPDEVSEIPSHTEIASRWPGLPAEEIDALEGDYELESSRVTELGLGEVFERVKELASEDIHFL